MLFLGAGIVSCSQQKIELQQPNIIYMFADDAGYADIEPFGSKTNRTPNLDRMANEGMKLTSHYAASTCTPSRASLMTGSYAHRVSLAVGSFAVVLRPGDSHGLHPDEKTVARILKDAGYATGCFGKWHLGDQPEFLPDNHGFDEYFGTLYSNNHWPLQPGWDYPRFPLLHNGEIVGEVKTMYDQAELCRLGVETAIDFIKKNKDSTFFAYIPFVFPHFPRRAREEFMDSAETVTQAQIEELDWAVGRIFETLYELDLNKRTIVFWASDNGGERGSSNAPLRGGKGSTWEGGIRTHAIAWWPGQIPAGSVSDEITSVMDMLPTFARLGGTEPHGDRIIDGYDIWPILSGQKGAKSPYKAYFYYSNHGKLEGVRSGNWKLRKGELYNLDKDISESTDVAKGNPDVVKRLKGYLKGMMEDIGDTDSPGPNVRPCGKVENPQTILPRPGLKDDVPHFPADTWPERSDAPQRPTPDDACAGTGPWSKIGNNWMICPVCLFAAPSEEFVEAITIPGESDGMNQLGGHFCPVCTFRQKPLSDYKN